MIFASPEPGFTKHREIVQQIEQPAPVEDAFDQDIEFRLPFAAITLPSVVRQGMNRS